MTDSLALLQGAVDGARLQLHVGAGFTGIAALVLIAAAALSVRAWLRSYRRTSILALEVLRLLLVAAMLFVLAQPEWVVTETPDEAPLVTVLWDDSGSMETRDVEGPEGLVTRAETVEARVAELEELRRGEGDGPASLDSFELVASPLTAAARGDGTDDPASDGARLGTDLRAPLEALLDQRTLRAVVLLSDGDWNEGGSPFDVATRYRLAGIPIFTATVGSPTRLPDIALAPVDPPAFAIVDRPVDLPISIDSAMPRDVSATVTLSDETGVIESHPLLVGAQRTTTDRFVYRPRAAGRAQLTVTVEPQPGELDVANNTRAFEIDVREERLRVLLVEGVPRWEYRYLRNALVRDPGVEVDCYLTHPDVDGVGGGPAYLEAFPPKEALPDYDVIFVGDVGLGDEGLTAQQCEMIAGLVRDQASGLILMPGLGGGHHELMQTELGGLFPVDLDPAELHGLGDPVAAPLALTEAGRASSLTRLLPGPDENSALWTEPRASSGTRPCGARGPAVRSSPCTGSARTSTDGSRSSSRAPRERGRCSSWAPTAPGAGVRASRTATTIDSGARSSAGWRTSAR